jgi:hypothetical protein
LLLVAGVDTCEDDVDIESPDPLRCNSLPLSCCCKREPGGFAITCMLVDRWGPCRPEDEIDRWWADDAASSSSAAELRLPQLRKEADEREEVPPWLDVAAIIPSAVDRLDDRSAVLESVVFFAAVASSG